MQDIGGFLREQREDLGLTLADVEVGTRIRQKYLAALEADEWHLLPGEVVGRGFLRNYTAFLGLDVETLLARRRSVVDPYLSQALSSTSAGALMPAPRQVDYRPKDVTLVKEPFVNLDDMEINPRKVASYVVIVLLIIVLAGGWWGIQSFGPRLTGIMAGVQTSVATFRQTPVTVSVPSGAEPGATDSPQSVQNGPTPPLTSGASTVNPGAIAPTNTPTTMPTATELAPPTPLPTNTTAPTPTQSQPPTATPVPAPTDTPEPPATATTTATQVPLPTPTTVPQIVSPTCGDPRALLTAPGVNQTVSGSVDITGTASHENFAYYKLEFAPGAGTEGGFVYFAGAENQIRDGMLGQLRSGALGNGVYTIRLTVVDKTGNFPAPCQVTITIQN